MTELKDSRFTELLPSDLKNDTETQAFAYAVSRQVQQVIRFADAACIYILRLTASRNLFSTFSLWSFAPRSISRHTASPSSGHW